MPIVARRLWPGFLLLSLVAAGPVPMAVQTTPPSAVRLTDGSPFKAAQEADHAYLLSLDPDRLLHYVRVDAGLPAKGDHYGGWEGGGAQMIGHYLSGCSLMYAATGDAQLKRRADYVVDELAACQQAGRDGPGGFGGLYNFPTGRSSYFPALFRGDVPRVPVSDWYHEHKLMAGLRDAWRYTGNPKAKAAWLAMCDWCVNVMSHLDEAGWQRVLDQEHGGPHEVLADAYAATGDPKYLAAAERWCHHKVFDPLAAGDDAVLDGLHANCQIPKFVGYERVSQQTADPAWHAAADHFWAAVVGHRSWAIGGNSQWEHFFPAARFPAEVNEVCGPETCNTYNMLKLTAALYERDPRPAYVDYYERGLFNHILSSIDVRPDGSFGGFAYYTSMQPGHYRVFSTPTDSFWCCVGTGMENHATYGRMVFARAPAGDVYLNLLVPCVATWPDLSMKLDTRFPDQDTARLTVTPTRPAEFTVQVRYPAWVSPGQMTVRVNGQPVPVEAGPSSYVPVRRTWRAGDVVEVRWPMHAAVEPLPHDDGRHVAVMYGPLVLATPMGAGELTTVDMHHGRRDMRQLAELLTPAVDVPQLVGDSAAIAAAVRPVPGRRLTFTFGDASRPADTTAVPFYAVGEQRYCLYWPTTTPDRYAADRAAVDRQAAVDRTVDPATVDHVIVGDAKDEAAHAVATKGSAAGQAGGPYPFWRDARGSFSYRLTVPASPAVLRCVYWGGDAGRDFDVRVDGRTVGTEHLTASRPGEFIVATYPIPRGERRSVTVRFEPHPGGVAGGVFDVRTVRATP